MEMTCLESMFCEMSSSVRFIAMLRICGGTVARSFSEMFKIGCAAHFLSLLRSTMACRSMSSPSLPYTVGCVTRRSA